MLVPKRVKTCKKPMHHGKFYVKDHMIEYSFKSLNFMTVLENNFLNFIAQILGKSAVAEFKF